MEAAMVTKLPELEGGIKTNQSKERERKVKKSNQNKDLLQDHDTKEHHFNPFVPSNSSLSEPQFRKHVSKAKWIKEIGMGEIIEKKGSIWTTTGIIRNGKLYCHTEELCFLIDKGALIMVDEEDNLVDMKDIYANFGDGKFGCTWESFEAYGHLKSLGYIIGRHGSSWCTKQNPNSPPGTEEDMNPNNIAEKMKKLQIGTMNPMFDVYLPNSKFKKTNPGDPNFILCLVGDKAPSLKEVEDLEKIFSLVPLKFCNVDHGFLSFFPFSQTSLPILEAPKVTEWHEFEGERKISDKSKERDKKVQGSKQNKSLLQEDDIEEHHFNPFLPSDSSNSSVSVPQCRAKWVEEIGMGEIIENEGSIWTNIGVIRNNKLYCHIEELCFLMEKGALILVDEGDNINIMSDIYANLAEGRFGCTWESFEAYRHLKSLGYIIGRHDLSWSKDTEDMNQDIIAERMKELQIGAIKPIFDVYLPNSKFRKTNPGDSNFTLCLVGDKVPCRKEVEDIEKNCNLVPLKFCHVDHECVSFFSFSRTSLPILP